MPSKDFCIRWDSYKKSLSKGFSRLQQNEEFVDMTLGADGHLVKVHQNIVALASPYLKAMLQSASCQHPVVFLNNITHETLAYILEYIYTGEVTVPRDVISVFLDACKALHITGVENFILPKLVTVPHLPDQAVSAIERIIDPSGKKLGDHLESRDLNVHNEPHVNSIEADIEPSDNNITALTKPPDNNFAVHIESSDNDLISHIKPSDNNNFAAHNAPMNIKPIEPPDVNPVARIVPPDCNFVASIEPPVDKFAIDIDEPPNDNFAAHITINSGNYNLEVTPLKIGNTEIDCNSQTIAANDNGQQDSTVPVILVDNGVLDFQIQNCSIAVDNIAEVQGNTIHNGKNIDDDQNIMLTSNSDMKPTIKEKSKSTLPPSIGNKDKVQHYTISNRGSLQLILNHYMYYCHHHSCGGRKRRWRCVDYRKLHCPAVIDTDSNDIVNRSEVHCHPYHDAKIQRKFKSKSVFTSLTQAEEKVSMYKERPLKAARKKK